MLTQCLNGLRAKLRKVVCPMDEVCNYVPLGSSVFDLGCGTGAMLLELIDTREARAVGGCEVSLSLLDTARRAVAGKLGNAGSFIEAKSPPEDIGRFDCVTLVDVLHHIPKSEQSAYIGQVAANMKPGAMLLLKDIDAASVLVWFNRLHDALFAGNGFQEISFECAKSYIVDSGLNVESTSRVRRLWYPHYFVLARKR